MRRSLIAILVCTLCSSHLFASGYNCRKAGRRIVEAKEFYGEAMLVTSLFLLLAGGGVFFLIVNEDDEDLTKEWKEKHAREMREMEKLARESEDYRKRVAERRRAQEQAQLEHLVHHGTEEQLRRLPLSKQKIVARKKMGGRKLTPKELFEICYFSDATYRPLWCHYNVAEILKQFDEEGFDLTDTEVVFFVEQGKSERIKARRPRNKLKKPWYWHVVFKHGDKIYDVDFTKQPTVAETKEYFEKMFVRSKNQSNPAKIDEVFSNLRIRIIPAEEYIELEKRRGGFRADIEDGQTKQVYPLESVKKYLERQRELP